MSARESAASEKAGSGRESAPEADQKETGRLEAFSDGVFAIAITLLILEIRVPAARVAAVGLRHALGEAWPSYIAYTLSFAIIGIMWANHHNICRFIGRANHTLVMLNLGLLFFVAFLP
ncbi:MAG TPA: TMEM175 family protein, partial [Thermoanaerobaculia bacterium]|nr:TMEM175 family protein [Thermoanaerobaculia bacterium]